jgi:hypothetical protein
VPKKAGKHGAKLTAFFNKALEEEHADLLDPNSNTYENVAMFILINKPNLGEQRETSRRAGTPRSCT